MAQMNFLQLVNRLKQECGVQGDDLTTTVGQTGIYKKLVDWVDQANNLIENQNQWEWMYRTVTFTIPAGASQLATTSLFPSDGFYVVDRKYLNIYDATLTTQTTNLQPVRFLEYRDFKQYYGMTPLPTAMPNVMTVNYDNTFYFNAIADKAYSFLFGYYREVQNLKSANPVATDDLNVPGIPQRFQLLIIAQAMIYYAQHETAPDVEIAATKRYDDIYVNMLAEQVSEIKFNCGLYSNPAGLVNV